MILGRLVFLGSISPLSSALSSRSRLIGRQWRCLLPVVVKRKSIRRRSSWGKQVVGGGEEEEGSRGRQEHVWQERYSKNNRLQIITILLSHLVFASAVSPSSVWTIDHYFPSILSLEKTTKETAML